MKMRVRCLRHTQIDTLTLYLFLYCLEKVHPVVHQRDIIQVQRQMKRLIRRAQVTTGILIKVVNL